MTQDKGVSATPTGPAPCGLSRDASQAKPLVPDADRVSEPYRPEATAESVARYAHEVLRTTGGRFWTEESREMQSLVEFAVLCGAVWGVACHVRERDTDGSPKGPDRNGLDGEAATAGAEGIAQTSPPSSEES